MAKRKQYIVDKKFQLKHTFTVVGIIFVVVALIISIIGINATSNNFKLTEISKTNDAIVKNLDNIMTIQDNILQTVMTWAQNPKEKPEKKAIGEVANRHFKNLQTIKANISNIQANIETNNRIVKYNNYLLLIIVIIVLLQSVILYFVMIRKTHKISGPIFVMSQYIKQIIEGKYPTVRPLRKNDELQEFYELFSQMVDELKKRENK